MGDYKNIQPDQIIEKNGIQGTEWLISDTHFYHWNIIKYCNRPENCFDIIIENWKNKIKETDTVYHLGDFYLGSKTGYKELINQLPGIKYLVRGNHDRFSKSFYLNNGWKKVSKRYLLKNRNIGFKKVDLLLTHYPSLIENINENWINIHGHCHNPRETVNPNLTERHFLLSIESVGYTPIKLENCMKHLVKQQ